MTIKPLHEAERRSHRWSWSRVPSRAAWTAARARNAARRGWTMTIIGVVATAVTVLVLQAVPRAVQRELSRQLAAVPPSPDTLDLHQQRVALLSRIALARQAAAERKKPGDTLSDTLSAALNVATPATGILLDSAQLDLRARVRRARAVPLTESWRSLALSSALRADVRVRAILDTIEQLDRDREAFAALGGPDARYAAMTSRLSVLGQRLVGIGDARIARDPADADKKKRSATVEDSVGANAFMARAVFADSVSQLARTDSVRQLTNRLDEARLAAGPLDERRAAIRVRTRALVPPAAMWIAALVIGASVGFAVVLFQEIRRPTVGDVAELERLTHASVLVHRPGGAVSASRRADRQGIDVSLAGELDEASSTFAMLHLTLTAVGSVAKSVQVLAADAALAKRVAVNLGAVAARESRAALIVEDSDVRRPSELAKPQASTTAPTTLRIGRDLTLDVLTTDALDGTDWERTRAPAYDLILFAGSAVAASTRLDLIVCVQFGKTPLKWLTDVTEMARANTQRLRAVVLFSGDTRTI